MKKSFAWIMMGVMLFLLAIPATVRAMLPEVGVYEKKAPDGHVSARMSILAPQGKSMGQKTLAASDDSPYIVMEALDSNGNVTEQLATQYVWKTDTAAAGEYGFRLTGENLQNALKPFQWFKGERFSCAWGEQVGFLFKERGVVGAFRCSDVLDGRYEKVAGKEPQLNVAGAIFAYECNYYDGAYQEKEVPAFSYRQMISGSYYRNDEFIRLAINDGGKKQKMLTVDRGFHIVMQYGQDSHEYQFIFTGDGYADWAAKTWQEYKGSVDVADNAMYLHQYMACHDPALIQDPNFYIKMTDFYCAEVPGSRNTTVFSVRRYGGAEGVQFAHAGIDDNAEIRFTKM